MGIDIGKITNANVYLNGESQIGRTEEITLPVIKNKGAVHKALGLVGSPKLPGGVEELTAKFKWNCLYRQLYRTIANPYKTVSIQARASMEVHTSEGLVDELPVVVFLRGYFDELPLGAYKQHDNVEIETGMNVTYVKLVVDGEDVVELDVLANIYKVDGEDLLANYRRNLGI